MNKRMLKTGKILWKQTLATFLAVIKIERGFIPENTVPGLVKGSFARTIPVESDGFPSPASFSATTRNSYSSPSIKSRTVKRGDVTGARLTRMYLHYPKKARFSENIYVILFCKNMKEIWINVFLPIAKSLSFFNVVSCNWTTAVIFWVFPRQRHLFLGEVLHAQILARSWGTFKYDETFFKVAECVLIVKKNQILRIGR